jgi:hypothetical protein
MHTYASGLRSLLDGVLRRFGLATSRQVPGLDVFDVREHMEPVNILPCMQCPDVFVNAMFSSACQAEICSCSVGFCLWLYIDTRAGGWGILLHVYTVSSSIV